MFWGEWEPPSEVVEEIDRPLENGPRYICRPYWIRPRSFRGLQNTDPFVFDGFYCSICKQARSSGPTQRRFLTREPWHGRQAVPVTLEASARAGHPTRMRPRRKSTLPRVSLGPRFQELANPSVDRDTVVAGDGPEGLLSSPSEGIRLPPCRGRVRIR